MRQSALQPLLKLASGGGDGGIDGPELPTNVPNKGCVVIGECVRGGVRQCRFHHIVKGQVLGLGAGWECEQNFGDDCGIVFHRKQLLVFFTLGDDADEWWT